MLTDWYAGFCRAVETFGAAEVAKRMGIGTSTVYVVKNGVGKYGKGTATTAVIEQRYRQTFEQITCPYTGKSVGIEICRENALRTVPTHNPLKLNQWKACQDCKFKPIKQRPFQPRKPHNQDDIPMVALDTRTLPLPEVGGPQIDLTIKERSE